MSRNSCGRAGLCAALAMIIAACGSSSTPSSGAASGTPLPAAQAGAQYLQDVAPVVASAASFRTIASGWTALSTDAQVYGDAQPLIAAEQQFNSELSSTNWPANAQTDIHTLISQNSLIIDDLNQLQHISLATIAAWDVNIRSDTTVDTTDSDRVRTDLGLAAASS